MIKFNETEIKFTKFSNNETKLQLALSDIKYKDINSVSFTYEDDSSLIELLIFKSHLDSLMIKNVDLYINYMPYSRLDREECNVAFTLKYISNLINSMGFDKVFVVEPHSDVCLATLNNATSIYLTPRIVENVSRMVEFNKENDFLFFPDAGAMKRYSKMFPDYKYLVGFKSRDFNSGNIDKLQILGRVSPNSKIIIVDDLCSGGRTFKMSAEKLKEVGCGNIYLVVAHCENAIFDYGFLDDANIEMVFTTDSIIKKQKDPKVNTLCI